MEQSRYKELSDLLDIFETKQKAKLNLVESSRSSGIDSVLLNETSEKKEIDNTVNDDDVITKLNHKTDSKQKLKKLLAKDGLVGDRLTPSEYVLDHSSVEKVMKKYEMKYSNIEDIIMKKNDNMLRKSKMRVLAKQVFNKNKTLSKPIERGKIRETYHKKRIMVAEDIKYLFETIPTSIKVADMLAKDDFLTPKLIDHMDNLVHILTRDRDLTFDFIKMFPVRSDLKYDAIGRFIKNIPPEFKTGRDIVQEDYNYSDVTRTCVNPKFTYTPNVMMSTVSNWYANRSVLTSTEGKDQAQIDLDCTRNAIANLVTTKPPFSRFGNFERQLAMFCYLKQVKSMSETNINNQMYNEDKGSKLHKYGWELVGIQALLALLELTGGIPWKIVANKYVMKDQKVDFNANLIQVCYTLLNIGAHEYLCNLSHDEAASMVDNVLEWMATNYCDAALAAKKSGRALSKILIYEIKLKGVLRYIGDGRLTKPEPEDLEEIMLDKEYDNLMANFNKANVGSMTVGKRFLAHAKQLPKHGDLAQACLNTEKLRRMIMVLNLMSTPTLYYHSSILLAIEKSGQPLTKTAPTVKIAVDKYAVVEGQKFEYRISYDQSPELLKIAAEEFRKTVVPVFHEKVKNIDLEADFVSSLTNNSQGMKIDAEEVSHVGVDVPDSILKMSQSRIVYFLYNNQVYNNLSLLEREMNKPSVIGSRSQIDRRFRIIVMVNNGRQIISYATLAVMDVVKPYIDGIAVGKQTGTLIDALPQLRATSGRSINNSMDVAGMDTHTWRLHQDFIHYMMLEAYDFTGTTQVIPKYFAFSQANCLVMDTKNEPNEEKLLNAMEMAMLRMRNIVTAAHLGQDKVFNKRLATNALSFASGLFGTSTQHTILLNSGLTGLTKWYRALHGLPTVHRLIMGDDIYESYDTTNFELVMPYLTVQQAKLLEINYDIELAVSRYSGVFLQLEALCGTYLPYPHRISLFTKERPDSLEQTPIQRMTMMRSIIDQVSSRSYAGENSLYHAVWEAIRGVYFVGQVGKEFESMTRPAFDVGKTMALSMFTIYGPKFRVGLPRMMITNSEGQTSVFGETYHTGLPGDGAFVDITQRFGKFDATTAFKLSDFLDVEALERYGVLQGFYLNTISPDMRITEKRRAEIGEDQLTFMINQLQSFQSPAKRFRSYNGVKRLEQQGLTIPDRLVYYEMPKLRVEEAVMVNPLSKEEVDQLREGIIYNLTSRGYQKWKNSKVVLEKFLYGLFEWDREAVGPDFSMNKYMDKLSLAPNGFSGGLFDTILMISDVVMNGSGSAIVSIGRWFNVYSKSNKAPLLDVLEEAIRVYSANPSSIYDFTAALGMSQRMEDELITSLKYLKTQQPTTPFKNSLSNTCHYYTSMDVGQYNKLLRFGNVKIPGTKLGKMKNWFSVMARDFWFTNPWAMLRPNLLFRPIMSKPLTKLLLYKLL